MEVSYPNDKHARRVSYLPSSKVEQYTPATPANSVARALKVLEGRWKLVIHLALI